MSSSAIPSAARITARPTRDVAAKTAGRMGRGADRDRLRRRDAGGARGGPDAGGRRRAARRVIPDGASPERLVVAYEPVWAIGTGKVPTLEQIGAVHGFIRARLVERFGAAAAEGIRLLYGGSVKPGNAADIFAVGDVDGALVGGASLKAADFGPIVAALDAAGD